MRPQNPIFWHTFKTCRMRACYDPIPLPKDKGMGHHHEPSCAPWVPYSNHEKTCDPKTPWSRVHHIDRPELLSQLTLWNKLSGQVGDRCQPCINDIFSLADFTSVLADYFSSWTLVKSLNERKKSFLFPFCARKIHCDQVLFPSGHGPFFHWQAAVLSWPRWPR